MWQDSTNTFLRHEWTTNEKWICHLAREQMFSDPNVGCRKKWLVLLIVFFLATTTECITPDIDFSAYFCFFNKMGHGRYPAGNVSAWLVRQFPCGFALPLRSDPRELGRLHRSAHQISPGGIGWGLRTDCSTSRYVRIHCAVELNKEWTKITVVYFSNADHELERGWDCVQKTSWSGRRAG